MLFQDAGFASVSNGKNQDIVGDMCLIMFHVERCYQIGLGDNALGSYLNYFLLQQTAAVLIW